MSRCIFHVDMDAFYTSVEQRDHPEYLGKPVVVGADPKRGKGRGVVAAASYEARAYGVHSAMPISRAYRLCPHAVFVKGNMTKYVEISRQIMEIFGSFTDLVEPISIDEAFLDVTASTGLFGEPLSLARRIKDDIRQSADLVASLGVAPNKFLAKVASDLEKPDGLVVVKAGEEQAFLRDLPVERLWGVGPARAEELHNLGIRKVSDITRLTRHELIEQFGVSGEQLYRLARGIDERPVVPGHEPKSIGQETTFSEDTGEVEHIRCTLLQLAEAVARRLRKKELEAHSVTLKFRDEHFVTETRARTLSGGTDDAGEIFQTARALLGRIKAKDRKVRLLGITAGKLVSAAAGERQLDLFAGEDKLRRLNRTLDVLTERFGDSGPRRASLLNRHLKPRS